jgi:CHU_C Type IX secretion signal domain
MRKITFLLTFLLISMKGLTQEKDTVLFYVPNVFSSWDCDMSTIEGFHVYVTDTLNDFYLTIFNRWGEILFESNDQEAYWQPWKNEGNEVADGGYIWQIEYSQTMDADFDGDLEKVPFLKRGQVFYLKR